MEPQFISTPSTNPLLQDHLISGPSRIEQARTRTRTHTRTLRCSIRHLFLSSVSSIAAHGWQRYCPSLVTLPSRSLSNMFSSLTTKLALKKAGLSSDMLDFSGPARPPPNKLRKKPPSQLDNDDDNAGWSGWMSVKSLPLSVQPWLSPPPPPVHVARVPGIGDKAPQDNEKKLVVGGGRRVLLVFLRCVGCACMSPHPISTFPRFLPFEAEREPNMHVSSRLTNNPQLPRRRFSISAPSLTATARL